VLVEKAVEEMEDLLSDRWVRLYHSFQDLVRIILEGSLSMAFRSVYAYI